MNSLLFLSGFGFQEIIIFILTLSFYLLIFLALRSLFLWYWKINTIIANQEAQIKLMSELISVSKTSSTLEGGSAVGGKSHEKLTDEEKARLFDQLNKPKF